MRCLCRRWSDALSQLPGAGLQRACRVRPPTSLLLCACLLDKVWSMHQSSIAPAGRRAQLEAQEQQALQALALDGVALSARRQAAAKQLQGAVSASLAQLAMPETRFQAAVSWCPPGPQVRLPQLSDRQSCSMWLQCPARPGRVPSALLAWSLGACLSAACCRQPPTWRSPTLLQQAHSLWVSRLQVRLLRWLPARRGARTCTLDPMSAGLDVVEFLVAAGPREPLLPLGTVASGGEASRIMLAFKAAVAARHALPPASECCRSRRLAACASHLLVDAAGTRLQPSRQRRLRCRSASGAGASSGACAPPVLVLDELEAGIGRLGAQFGATLQEISRTSQTIVATHLAQVPSISCLGSCRPQQRVWVRQLHLNAMLPLQPISQIDESHAPTCWWPCSPACMLCSLASEPAAAATFAAQVAACGTQHVLATKQVNGSGMMETSFEVLDAPAARLRELQAMQGGDAARPGPAHTS